MLDIKFLRENPDIVKQNIKNKFQDRKLPLVDEVIELDLENRKIKQEVEALRADRNKLSKQIGGLMAKGEKEEAERVKAEVAKNSSRVDELTEKEKEVEVAREHLNEAMKERKTFEKLKEKAFEKFVAEENQKEQKEVDELVSYRYGAEKFE